MTEQLKVVLLGGNGFLGSALFRRLEETGHDVIVAGTRSYDFPWDITDGQEARRAILKLNPGVVVNLAAAGVTRGTAGRELMRAVNADGPVHLIDAIMQSDVLPRLIHVASCRELDTPSPDDDLGFYGTSKAIGTAAVYSALQNSAIAGSVLRVHSAYGAGQPFDRFVAWMVRRVRSNESIELYDPHKVLDLVHVDDVADALVRAVNLTRTVREIIDIGTGRAVSVLETTQLAIHLANADPLLVSCRVDADNPSGNATAPADTSAAHQHLGWKARTSLIDGLRALVVTPP